MQIGQLCGIMSTKFTNGEREICENGGAIFFSTHVLDVAEKLCNKVAIIKDGKMVASGNMNELVKNGESLEEIFMEVLDGKTD